MDKKVIYSFGPGALRALKIIDPLKELCKKYPVMFLITAGEDDILNAYKEKYGEIPSSPWPIYAADAFSIIAYAVDKCGSTDSDVLAAYLRDQVNAVPGITGPIGFTKQGDREGVPFYLYVVDASGKIVISK